MTEETWFEKLGYEENPLVIKPLKDEEIVGFEDKIGELLDSLDKGAFWILNGAYGTGKSSILKQIIEMFIGQGRLVYYSLNRVDRSVDFVSLLKKRASFFKRLFGIMPKNAILLLDEAERITAKDCDNLMELYGKGVLKSVVFVSTSMEKLKLSDEIKKLVGENVFETSDLKDEDALKFIRNRLEDLDYIDDKQLIEIFHKSDRNPRRFLENVEDVLRVAVEDDADKVSEKHIKKIVG